MIISFGRKTILTDTQIIREIQRRNERITELFYNECKKYFMSSYKAVFTREDIKDDVFQQSFVKLWTEIETRKIFLDENENIQRKDRRGNIRKLTCNLKTFLIDIAKNDYRDWLRKERLYLADEFESFAHMIEVKSAVMPEESDKTTGEIQGHEWVDLGLSVKWATCNVGAESPEEYGGCYTWSSTDDIATKKWGSKWRMPTKEEFEELSEDCTWKWTTKDGVNGYEVKGDNGNSIFLPAAGYYYGSSRQEDGETGYYWSSTPYQNNSRAYGIDFNEEGRNIYRYALSYEQSVRPVCE